MKLFINLASFISLLLAPTFTKADSNRNQSMTTIYSSFNTSFVVTDPRGRKTGYDPFKKVTYKEIPQAQYSVESIDTPSEPEYEPETLIKQYKYSNMVSVENGKYQITLYGVATGPYSVTVYSSCKNGNRNDGHLFEGQIKKGQTKTYEFTQTDVSLPYFNAELSINYAFFLHPDNKKNDKVIDRIILKGKISTQLTLNKKLIITIGGISGYKKEFKANEFLATVKNNEKSYQLIKNQNTSLVVNSNGEFQISLKDIDLNLIQMNKWGDFMMEIDDTNAQVNVTLKCKDLTCFKK